MLIQNSPIIKIATMTADEVRKNIKGRAADGGPSLPWVGIMAGLAGPGNHVETGTLFGASAITAALCKKRLSMPGSVYCIDPYLPRQNINPLTEIAKEFPEGSPDILRENAEKFGLVWGKDIIHVHKVSDPWPLDGQLFNTGFIDGDHVGETPYNDFLAMEKAGCALIGFDNYEEGYPDVREAVHRVIRERSDKWTIHFKDTIFLSFRRIQPPRGSGIPIAVL